MGKKHQDLLVNAQQIVNPFYVEFLGGCGQALEFTLKPSLIFSGLCSNGSESYGWSIDEDCRWWGGRHCHHCCPTLRVIPNRPTWWWCHPRPQTCIEFVTCATKWLHIWCPNVRKFYHYFHYRDMMQLLHRCTWEDLFSSIFTLL